jgi:hypothetical protein
VLTRVLPAADLHPALCAVCPAAGVQPSIIAQRLAFQAFSSSQDKTKQTPYRWMAAGLNCVAAGVHPEGRGAGQLGGRFACAGSEAATKQGGREVSGGIRGQAPPNLAQSAALTASLPLTPPRLPALCACACGAARAPPRPLTCATTEARQTTSPSSARLHNNSSSRSRLLTVPLGSPCQGGTADGISSLCAVAR